jgi:hypothetical protein
VNGQTTVNAPRGEYVQARAGGASGTGIIRQSKTPPEAKEALRKQLQGDDSPAPAE